MLGPCPTPLGQGDQRRRRRRCVCVCHGLVMVLLLEWTPANPLCCCGRDCRVSSILPSWMAAMLGCVLHFCYHVVAGGRWGLFPPLPTSCWGDCPPLSLRTLRSPSPLLFAGLFCPSGTDLVSFGCKRLVKHTASSNLVPHGHHFDKDVTCTHTHTHTHTSCIVLYLLYCRIC